MSEMGMTTRPSLVLLTVWLAACGGSVSDDTGRVGSAGSSGSSTQSIDLLTACGSFFVAEQAWVARCQPGDLSTPEAQSAYVASCASLLSLPGVNVTVADVDACSVQVRAQTDCNATPACLGDSWPMYLPGHGHPGDLALGEVCQSDVQCASGECAAWAPQTGSGGPCRVCIERRAEGQSCDQPDQLCREGMTCLDGVCGWPATRPGQECVQYGANACPFGLFCDAPEEGKKGTCQLRPGRGEPCGAIVANFSCREDLYCLDGTCLDRVAPGGICDDELPCQIGFTCREGHCQAPRYDVPVGGDCSFYQCAAGLVCSPDALCQPAVVVGEGDECSYKQLCSTGLMCSLGYLPGTPAGRCFKAPAAGEPCLDMRCGPLATCVDIDFSKNEPGHCVALGNVGEACPCFDSLACLDGVCRPLGTYVCQ